MRRRRPAESDGRAGFAGRSRALGRHPRLRAAFLRACAKRRKWRRRSAKLVAIPVITVRMKAVKGLWQFWFWTPDVADQEPDRRHAAGALWPAAAGVGRKQSARRRLQPGGREHPLPLQQLGAAAGPRRRIASARFTAGWPWKRGWRPSSPRCWTRARTCRRRRCCARSPSSRCAAAISTIWKPTSTRPRRPSTTASATISSRSRSSARAPDRMAQRYLAAARFDGSGDAAAGRRGRPAGARRHGSPR